MLMMIDIERCLFTSGTRFAPSINAPDRIPALTDPKSAPLTTKTVELGAAAQMVEPASKTKRAIRNIRFMLR